MSLISYVPFALDSGSLLHTPSLTRGSKLGSSGHVVIRCSVVRHSAPGPDSKHELFLKRRIFCRRGHGSVPAPLEAIEVFHLEGPKGPVHISVCYGHLDIIGSVGSCRNQGTQHLHCCLEWLRSLVLLWAPLSTYSVLGMINGGEQHTCMFLCVISQIQRSPSSFSLLYLLKGYMLMIIIIITIMKQQS